MFKHRNTKLAFDLDYIVVKSKRRSKKMSRNVELLSSEMLRRKKQLKIWFPLIQISTYETKVQLKFFGTGDMVCSSLTTIFSNAQNYETYPDTSKTADVTPLPKGREKR